jgi:hypothetical protein
VDGVRCILEAAEMMLTLQVLWAVLRERRRQDRLYGRQDHVQVRWANIEGEELGEVNRAIYEAWHNHKSLSHARHEWVHVAAVAVAAIESLDRNGGQQ